MSAKPLRFRPTVQTLEHRRCLTGVMGTEDLAATPTEPAGEQLPQVTITDTTTSGNTPDSDAQGGGGIFNDGGTLHANQTFDSCFAYNPAFVGGVRVATGDINGDGFADIITGADAGGGSHGQVSDGTSNTLLMGEMQSRPASANNTDAVDSLFTELGRDTTASAVGSHEVTGAVVKIN